MEIWSIRMQIWTSQRDSNHLNGNSKQLNEIRSIRMYILTLKRILTKFEPFERDSKHSNAYFNDLKGILTIRMQIQTRFETIKCKF